jgi:hypothetical protein
MPQTYGFDPSHSPIFFLFFAMFSLVMDDPGADPSLVHFQEGWFQPFPLASYVCAAGQSLHVVLFGVCQVERGSRIDGLSRAGRSLPATAEMI